MTAKLFVALYVGLFVGMFILFFTNFPVGWIFFAFLFVAVFGGIAVSNRPYLIAGGFLLTSLLVFGIGLLGMYQSWQVGAWPKAAGEITRSWTCTRTTNGSVVYSGPCIDYAYSARGQEFQASSIDTREFEQQWWLTIPDRFKQGREVQVFYDPGNPANSRLTAEFLPRDWITVLIGGALAVLSAVTLFRVGFRKIEPPLSYEFPRATRARNMRTVERAKSVPDIADQLEKLAGLHESKAISDDEYEQAKKQLLGMS